MSDSVPPVWPCRTSQTNDDKRFDFVEIRCDGREHVLIQVKDGIEVGRSRQTCDRFQGYSGAYKRKRT